MSGKVQTYTLVKRDPTTIRRHGGGQFRLQRRGPRIGPGECVEINGTLREVLDHAHEKLGEEVVQSIMDDVTTLQSGRVDDD